MLDFIYYPISAVLWFWHRVFGLFLGADSGVAWSLSVVFLVFTVRAILFWPGLVQARTGRAMQALTPKFDELRSKHGHDRERLGREVQKVQREHGVNPFMGCLPALIQVPVFLGLFQVLRSFNRTGTGLGQLGLSPEANASLPNYVFSAGDVQSFLHARLFGAPISAAITSPQSVLDSFAGFGGVPTTATIALVAIPLMLTACVATHVTARASMRLSVAADPANPQAAIMQKLMLWVMPVGSIVAGPILMIAVLLYWVANNVWTFGQVHAVHRILDRESARASGVQPSAG
nr:membrane protein insertase YidC [Tsukamurella sp. 1534]